MKNILLLSILFLYFSNQLKSQHDADSLRNILKVWNIEDNHKEKLIEKDDSSLEMFHLANVEEKYSILNSNLGNLGSASVSDNYFKRYDFFNNNFLFNEVYFNYIKNSKNALYYNTRRPYTSIMHTTSTKIKDFQTIDFTHTQNVHPDFNFGINYNFLSSLGQYAQDGNQSTRINSVGITLNIKKNRYFGYLSFTYNKFSVQNSGGFPDSTASGADYADSKLDNSFTNILNQELSYTHFYKLGKYKNLSYKDTIIKVLEPKISISHNISLQRKYRIYEDVESTGSVLYNNFYFQEGITYDSVGYRSVSNSIRIGSEDVFEKTNNFGFSLILNAEYYEMFNFKRYFFLENKNIYFENHFHGEIYSNFSDDLFIKVFSKYYFSGYRSGDLRIAGYAKKNIFKHKPSSYIALDAQYTKQKADYFHNRFYSNHYSWENDFIPTETFDISLTFSIPRNFFHLKTEASYIRNYIWFGPVPDTGPSQFDLDLAVVSASAEKNFHFKRFGIHNKVIWQYSSNDTKISLPIIAAYQSSYFKFLYNNSLKVHLGYDVYYSTEYQALSYNPAIGQFYFEESGFTGNYPNISVFANLKIKRNVFIFLKMGNITSGILSNPFISNINSYPIRGRIFKFGIRWTFKN